MYGRPIRDVMITLNGSDNVFYIISSSKRRHQKRDAVSDLKRAGKWIPVRKKNHT